MFTQLNPISAFRIRGAGPGTLIAIAATLIVMASILTGQHARAVGSPVTQIFLYDAASGLPVDRTSSTSLTEGHVVDITTNVDIGVVPNQAEGHIIVNGNPVGFISPSEAAAEELPPDSFP